MGKYTSAAVLAVRLMGLFWVIAGLWMLMANIIESALDFNPTYLGYYLVSQALRPLLAVGFGIILSLFSKKLGRCLACGLDPKNDA